MKPSPKQFPKKKNTPSPIPLFPMRINKYLAHKGYATRRGADDFVKKRWVTINGKIAMLGDKVVATDNIEVRNNKKAEDYLYYAYHKARGTTTESITTRELFPVLSLDTQAEGLVILTNDRRIIDRLTNPQYSHIKEYMIKTISPLRPNFKEKMEQGIVTANGERITSTISIRNEKVFTLRSADLGNHIRQMCATFFAEIESLTRTKILNIEIGHLKPNDRREIIDEELNVFLKKLGL